MRIVANNETHSDPRLQTTKSPGEECSSLPRDRISAVPRALLSCSQTDNGSMDPLSPQRLYSTRQRVPGDPSSSPHVVLGQRGQLLLTRGHLKCPLHSPSRVHCVPCKGRPHRLLPHPKCPVVLLYIFRASVGSPQSTAR